MTENVFRARVNLLLSNLEEGREVRSYLRHFSAVQERPFAVIKISGRLIANELALLAERLTLLQVLGLVPIVIFGAGPQLDQSLADHNFANKKRDGLRVTPAEATPIIAREIAHTGLALVQAITNHGGQAVLMSPGTITARVVDTAAYGCVGDAESVDKKALEPVLGAGIIPLVGCAHINDDGQTLNINADSVARRVAIEMKPLKIVFLTETGGLLDDAGSIIDSINLVTDYKNLINAEHVQGGMALKLREIEGLLNELPMSSSVSITNSSNMLRELFTHGGAGTLIRRGEQIEFHSRSDPAALTPLLETAFGRSLVGDYWKNLQAEYILITENQRAAAIVSRKGDIACLDKFAVVPAARGEGLAKAVWRQMITRSPKIIWRSKPENPINAFYQRQADGYMGLGEWDIFWCGAEMDADLLYHAKQLADAPAHFVGTKI